MKHLAIIGLAKNAGKTVTLNKVVKEAFEKNVKMALISYGRDGEKVDSITLQEKPRIYIPPHTVFVTAENAFRKSSIEAKTLVETDIDSLLGKVNIYKSKGNGGNVELVGINSSSRVKKIKEKIPNDVDLILIDGALDRRSSAMPSLTEAFIMATGAVLANTEDLVIKKTMHEIRRLTLPQVSSKLLKKKVENIFDKGKDGIILKNGNLKFLESKTSFGHLKELQNMDCSKIDSLIINGALIDSFVEKLIYDLKLKDLNIIVQDGTRVFLNKRNMNLLEKANNELKVFNNLNLLAVTVNPTSPYSASLDANKIIKGLNAKLAKIPVYDILSEKYKSIER
ncbi:MAG: hypothetical protein ACQEQF_11435 [Bacillota bacterium]